ncbi:hypothetical protein [Ralstonia flatus]|uniref:Integrase n=1 Tax=Ralstonia flatus TaxID=3058601 RepID=A0ABN9KKX2_9RALS|nr:hypothetical protein [Ralstonia sp. LMG 32965]CAJ0895810.1 hypothetical protein R77564_03928 [Ralstonia sp. LMG 32965]
MPPKTNRPADMRARRNRDGTSTFYMLRPGGQKLILGNDFGVACSRWVDEQHTRVRQSRPATALALLDAFEQCSLPLLDTHATAHRSNELAILREYFTKRRNPRLEAINCEVDFLTWYGAAKRASLADAVIRLFRLVWKFAQRLEISNDACPWKSFDLSKARLQLEAADVLHGFAPPPLKDLLGALLTKGETTTIEHDRDPSESKSLQVQLRQAVSLAVARLRSCGRLDLVPAMYQLTVDDLIALRGSPTVALARPPGRILLEHRRKEALASLRSEAKPPTAARTACVKSHTNAVSQTDNNLPVVAPRALRQEEQ